MSGKHKNTGLHLHNTTTKKKTNLTHYEEWRKPFERVPHPLQSVTSKMMLVYLKTYLYYSIKKNLIHCNGLDYQELSFLGKR